MFPQQIDIIDFSQDEQRSKMRSISRATMCRIYPLLKNFNYTLSQLHLTSRRSNYDCNCITISGINKNYGNLYNLKDRFVPASQGIIDSIYPFKTCIIELDDQYFYIFYSIKEGKSHRKIAFMADQTDELIDYLISLYESESKNYFSSTHISENPIIKFRESYVYRGSPIIELI